LRTTSVSGHERRELLQFRPYSWQNTGISANINQSTTVSAGNMTLVITDANGTQVYSRSLADNGTFVTADGVAGTWTIRVTYSSASGTVNFRAQKKTDHAGPDRLSRHHEIDTAPVNPRAPCRFGTRRA
jgi:hypothetical protein